MKNQFWFSKSNIDTKLESFKLEDLKFSTFVMDFETSEFKTDEYRVCIATYALLAVKKQFVNYFKGYSQVWEKGKDVLYDTFTDCIEIVKRKGSYGKKIDIWFNYSSKFDNEYILDWFIESGFTQSFSKKLFERDFRILGSGDIGLLQIEFLFKGYHFVIRDLWRFTSLQVKTLGNIVGEEKLVDIGEKYYDRKFNTLNQQEVDEYVYYAIIDVKVLWKGFKLFHKFINLNNKRMTIPSYALNNWKEMEGDKKKYLKIDSFYYSINSYFGGYSNGNDLYKNKLVEGDIHCYDINSAYPFAMTQLLPVGEPYTEEDLEELNYNKESFFKLYSIGIKKAKLKKDLIPIIRNYHLSNVFYKNINGYVKYDVWEKELKWFEKYYDIEYDILEIKYFDKDYVFKNYINHWYGIKEKSSKILNDIKKGIKYEYDEDYYNMMKYTSKLMMNSLYGKFGQKPIFPYYIVIDKELEKGDIIELRYKTNYEKFGWMKKKVRINVVKSKEFPNDFNMYEVEDVDEWGDKIIPVKCNNVFIASYITMYVRTILFELIYDLKTRFLYSDTDSIYCIGKIDDKFLDDYKLGFWKKEREDNYFKFLGSKCYITSKERIVSKDKNISKIVISGVNNYKNIIGLDIDKFTYGMEFNKKSSKLMKKGKKIYDNFHIIKDKMKNYE